MPSFVPLRLLSPSLCICKIYDIVYETELYTLRRSGSVSLKCIFAFLKVGDAVRCSGQRLTSASRIGMWNANPIALLRNANVTGSVELLALMS